MVRQLGRRCGFSLREALALTLSQALLYLDDSDPNDPHRGNAAIHSLDDLRRVLGPGD